MPLIEVQLSAKLSAEDQVVLMTNLSKAVAGKLGKPESYMMVVLRPEAALMMGARPDPAALVQVRSVGTISPSQAREIAGAVSQCLAKVSGIEEDRVYCVFQGVPGAMWAQGADTFG
jgi:phenylpyruvate tautomerase